MSYTCYNCGEELAGMETCSCPVGQRNTHIVKRAVALLVPEGLNETYALIDKEWKEWVKDLKDEHSLTNLYGLDEVDAILHIHKLLNERGL